MNYTIGKFTLYSILISVIMATIFQIPITLIFLAFKIPFYIPLILFIPLVAIIFLIVIRLPNYNLQKLGSKMESEVAVTGRRLLIQLESGKSLVNALIDIGTKHKKGGSKSLERISYELYMGKPLEDTIEKAIRESPSQTFKKIFIQIRNSLKTGADIKHTLKATLEDITRDKIVEFETFANKLNPLGLFYVILGTIAPSLGVVIFVIMLAVINIKITWTILSVFLFVVIVIQLIFISVFSKMRPRLEI